MNILFRIMLMEKIKRQFYWNDEMLKKHQEKKIKELIQFVSKKSPFYKNIKKFSDFPMINKEIMMNNFNTINTSGLDKSELFEFRMNPKNSLSLYKNEFSVGMSSGTSGNKGLTVLSKHEMQSYGSLLFARSGIPKHFKKRILFALRVNNPSFMEVKKLGVRLVYVDYTISPKKIIELINNKQLNIIAGPPSLLQEISKHVKDIITKIDLIISYAEVLSDDVKNILELRFNAKVIQIYQGSEGFIASTCKCGKLHLNEDLFKFEFEKAGDEFGNAQKIIITDLYRKTQPIIRYSINDLVELDDSKCECGSLFKVIKKIYGRVDDIFILKGKDNEKKLLFPDYIRRSIIQSSDDIIEYQAIQRSIDNIEIRLILKNNNNNKDIEKKIIKNLEGWVKKLNANLGKVNFVYKNPEHNKNSNKLIRIVKLWK